MVTIETIKNGPYIVKGEVEVIDADAFALVARALAYERRGEVAAALLDYRKALGIATRDKSYALAANEARDGIRRLEHGQR